MPHISKKTISESAERELRDRFVNTIQRIGRDRHTKHALRELFTHTESIMLAKRLGIIYMIRSGHSTLYICEALSVSSSTVIRIEKIYDRGGYSSLEKVLGRLETDILGVIGILIGGEMPIFGRGGMKRISKILNDSR